MDTIVKVLNEKVEDGNAKTIVEALKQIDTSAEGDTVAEVLKNMNLGGGGGAIAITPILKLTLTSDSDPMSLSYCIINGKFYEGHQYNAGETAEVIVPCMELIPSGEQFTCFIASTDGGVTCDLTNLVNCTEIDEAELVILKITDPSKNASATVKLTESE